MPRRAISTEQKRENARVRQAKRRAAQQDRILDPQASEIPPSPHDRRGSDPTQEDHTNYILPQANTDTTDHTEVETRTGPNTIITVDRRVTRQTGR